MPINKKSRLNNIITWLHLWLGLVSGIVVLIVSITGCLFVFQEEISHFIHHKTYYVEPPASSQVALPLSALQRKAQAALGPDAPVTYMTTYADGDRSWEFMSYVPGDPDALTYGGTSKVYKSAFLNPYTGSVTGMVDYRTDFFMVVKGIHWSLYLNDAIGQRIVGWSTVIFVILLITGLIMWWPKKWNKKSIDNSFKISWKAKFKRLNYDLHNVLGFYAFIIALIIALTGLTWAFQWFNKAVYATATLSSKPISYPDYSSDTTAVASIASPIDYALAVAHKVYPNAKRYTTAPVSSKAAAISVSAYGHEDTYYDANTLYFDQGTGKELGQELYKRQNLGHKLVAMNYDIHVGAIGGLIGKIIAFLISLVCASLPITGFYIWWGKKRKQKKKYSKELKVWNKYQKTRNGTTLSTKSIKG
ncbi:Uncharacterized iron-regulated membrane protein [Arachidicoccus rhizosphaerae]|uniref:Uncharacterized iron-regulated membrane protein n=1 Tax=Arachidicoccus rhizosphaerae TaxID=551991 RepID=A0A1H3YYG4_9BACT|nr:PepSY-associated TM helix domain-containing protein [Arachidicoccus rhizosphaerae]SEA16104.1 Uncharacterized iron-regulated membrane protein [Arachidicoccus rhizosphaerae]